MKLLIKLLVTYLMVNLFISCTQDNSVEEGLRFEYQDLIDSGEDENPMDNNKVR